VAGLDAEAFAMAKTNDHVYVGGYNEVSAACGSVHCSQWRIEKRSVVDGSLVPEFGTGGVLNRDPTSEFDSIAGLAIEGTALYAVGIDSAAGWRVEKRSLTSAQLDGAFGTAGSVYSTPTLSFDTATAVTSDGSNLYIVGYSSDENFDTDVWKIEVRGLVSGTTGTVISSANGVGLNQANAIAHDGTDMFIAGFDSSPGNAKWRIEKRSMPDGVLDEIFTAASGSNPGVADDEATAIAVDAGNIYVAGYETATAPNTLWRIEKRDKVTGDLDAGFGTAGVISRDHSAGDDEPTSIVLDTAAGFMYIAGYQNFDADLGTGTWRIEKRSMTTGDLDMSFGSGGSVVVDPAADGNDTAWAIATDPTDTIFIVGYDSATATGNKEWRLEKRTE
jgi:hypothetical protein